MKCKSVLSLLFLILLFGTNLEAQKSIAIGTEAPSLNVSVEDINGRSINLSQIAESNGLLVVFWGNTCPAVSRLEDRMISISNIAQINRIGIIALNANERIRDRGESISDMKRRSTKQGYTFNYALDKDHVIADAFGATKTPEVFLFDSNMILVYKGSIDDNVNNASAVKSKYLENAISAIMNGNSVQTKTSIVNGCSIKRIE